MSTCAGCLTATVTTAGRPGARAPAEPGTPARFDVLVDEPGRFAVFATPAGSNERRRVGTLVVRSAEG